MAKGDKGKGRGGPDAAGSFGWDALPEALRDAGKRAADLAQNPYARSLLAAGLVAAAAALASNKKVREASRRNLKNAAEAVEVGTDSAGRIGLAMVNAATEAVQAVLNLGGLATGEGSDTPAAAAAPANEADKATPAKAPAARSRAAKPAAAKAGAAKKPAPAKASAAKRSPPRSVDKPAAAKPAAAKSLTTKSSGGTSSSGKSSNGKSSAGKSSAAKSPAAKSTAAKSTAAKPARAQAQKD